LLRADIDKVKGIGIPGNDRLIINEFRAFVLINDELS
jgi:hypothetical protein